MSSIEKFKADVLRHFPNVVILSDHPHKSDGNYWLDIIRGEQKITIEWRPTQGFGFYANDAGFGEGPEKVFPNAEEALIHTAKLLES